ncbi:hypothetical protein E5288_WYG022499 [Bos mutus]|uniref:Uncharacterized protein n=1 Tax=Bos mutus TaxID=72004 RepID=A0A6B0RL65_9CETA|nr:hypothetical protein [Bos mutus]
MEVGILPNFIALPEGAEVNTAPSTQCPAKGRGVPWLVWNRFSILVPGEDLKSRWSLTQHRKGSFSAAINVTSHQDTKVATLPFTSMKGPSAFAAAAQGPEH